MKLKLKVFAMIFTIALAGCNTSTSPSKKNNYSLKLEEDQTYIVDLYETINEQIKDVEISISNNEIIKSSIIDDGRIKLTPTQDSFGNTVMTVLAKNTNGVDIIFNYNISISPVNDSPTTTKDSARVEYNALERIYTGIDVYDIDSELLDFESIVVDGSSEALVEIEDNKIYITPNVLGLNKEIPVNLQFNDKNDVFLKSITINIEYIKGQIPLTESSLTNITILEDENYMGTLEPKKIYESQIFNVEYQTNETIGTVVEKDNYKYEYIPANNFNGIDRFFVKISNSDGDIVIKEITITIVSDLDGIIINNISHTMEEDAVASIDINIIDPENSPSYNFTILSGLENGEVVFNGKKMTYTPNRDYFGVETITINALDNINNRSVDFTVQITVISSLDPLAIDDQVVTILRGHSFSDTFSFYDAENGEYSFSVGEASSGVTSISQEGVYTYVSNVSGSIYDDSFEIYVLDSNNKRTDSLTISIKIIDNDSPNELLSVNEDVISENTLPVGVINGQESSFEVLKVISPINGTLTINSNRTFNYKSFLNFFGEDYFTVSVKDLSTDLIYTLKYDVIVVPVVDNIDDTKIIKSLSVLEDSNLTYDLSELDLDKVGTTTYIIKTDAENGSLSVDINTGLLSYTPDSNFSGVDNFLVTVNKSDSNEILDLDFGIRVIAGEDPLYLTNPIEIEMYGRTKYSFNIKDIVVNEDPEDFIFIGSKLISDTVWSIDTGEIPVFDIRLDALTGQLTVADLGLLNQDDTRTYKFAIREVESGTVRRFDINIKIIDKIFVVNNMENLEEFYGELSVKENLLLCPGAYIIGENNLFFENIGIYGTNNTLGENDSKMDILHNCQTKEGESVLTFSAEGGIELSDNSIINGVTINNQGFSEKPLEILSSASNVEISSSIFKAEIPNVGKSFIYGHEDISNLKINNNNFKGFTEEAEDPNAIVQPDDVVAANLMTIIDSFEFNSNNVENIKHGLKIDGFKQSALGEGIVESTINLNVFNNTTNAINIQSTHIENQENVSTIEINNNNIMGASESIRIGKVTGVTGGQMNVNMSFNNISDSKNGLNINENGGGLINSNLLLSENIITVKEKTGIKVVDQMVTSSVFVGPANNIQIVKNNIQTSFNTFSEENSGILISVGYFDQVAGNREPGYEVNMMSNYESSIIIAENIVGDKTGLFKFNKYGIGFIKQEYTSNIVGSENFSINAQLSNNTVFGRNDVAIDEDVDINPNKYEINLNLENNALETSYPSASLIIKEKNTDLCVYLVGNTIDFIDMYNEDINSTVSISDIDEEGELVLFNNNTVGNALLTSITYEQIEKCH